jgi:hypothetical protein
VEQQPRIHNLCVRMAVDKTAKVFGIILRELRSAAGLSQENHARTFTSYQQDGDYSPPRGRRPLLHAVPTLHRPSLPADTPVSVTSDTASRLRILPVRLAHAFLALRICNQNSSE